MSPHLFASGVLLILCFIYVPSNSQDPQQVQCLVCYSVLDEIQTNISQIKPHLKTSAGGYQLDNDGNMHAKVVEYSHSTVYLSELMDNVCNVMEDYVKATDKETGELLIMPLVLQGKMNPRMGSVDVIQDPDLNKNIKYYCEQIISENEDLMIDLIQMRIPDLKHKMCHQETDYCKGEVVRDEL